jgi:peptidoglycan/LPS O-acetylase OafA/YrhL
LSKDETHTPFFLPGLNGIRGIGILGVIVSHTVLALNKFGLDNTILGTTADGHARGLDFSHYAVTMFFVLSGFLITTLLIKEKQLTGKMSVKNFYIRRILRIWPLYYSYMIIALVVLYITGQEYNTAMVPFYIFLMANIPFILGDYIPLLGHYWTLGVEEQFYLLFPSIARLDNKKLLRWVVILLLLYLLLKFIAWYMNYTGSYEFPYRFFLLSRFQGMMIGVIAALLYEQKHSIISLISNRWFYAAAWFCVVLSMFNLFHIASFIDHEIIILATVIIIFEQIQNNPKIFNLENPLLDLLGKISYGIYVTHLFVIFLLAALAKHLMPYGLVNYYTVFIAVLFCCILSAYLSYQYFEKPFLKMKKRFEKVSGITVQ